MFNLVVLIASLALAAAKPGALFYGPTAYSTVLSPATTTITQQASSVVHPSPPLLYSSPLTYTHFIKKRSAPFYGTYLASSPYYGTSLATTYSAPLIHSASYINSAPIASALPYVAATHLIKKRSAPLVSSYLAPTTYAAASPFYATSYAAASPLHAAPLITSAPLISHPYSYSPHFIKKRSAPLLAAYSTIPTSYSHQSRVDYTHAAPYVTTYSSPLTYTSPSALSYVL